MSQIEIGCCSFVFGGLSLEASLGHCRNLGFRRVDVSAADIGPGAQVDQQAAVARPEATGRRVRDLAAANGLEMEELFLCPVFVEGRRVEVSAPDGEARRKLLENFVGICRFASEAGFRSVMAVPGTPQPGLDDGQAWGHAVPTLRQMVRMAGEHGLDLNVEPHTGSLIEQPAAARRLAEAVPGLAFTLDYAHFVSRGIPQSDVVPLHAFTRHLHARQAKPGDGHCPVEEGEIDFAGIVADLRQRGWCGAITMEYFGKPEEATAQNLRMAEELRRLLT